MCLWRTLPDPPPVSNLTTLQIWFSDFHVYLLTLLIDPPPLSLWSKSWKWYTALHSIQLYIYLVSLYELCHLELSKWTGQSCICFYAKFLSISLWFYHVVDDFIMWLLLLLLLLLLCITPQHIYVVVVVVVVVVYYTSGTITTTIHRNWLWSLC